jgi:uncharacterized protein (DUF697 family)
MRAIYACVKTRRVSKRFSLGVFGDTMATEKIPSKQQAAPLDNDAPTIEVKEEPMSDVKPVPTKDSVKPLAKEEPKPLAKEEPKPLAKEEPKLVAKEEPKPLAKEEPKPLAKEEPKPLANAAEEPKPAAKEEPKPAAKEEPKPAAKEAPKPAARPIPPVDTVSRVGRAEAIVRRNVLWSLGAGVVPFPIFDAIAITGVQLKMISELSELYKVSFTESIAKKIIGSLLSSLGGVTVGAFVGASLAKFVPVVGTALGIVSIPLAGGAFTNATGRIFVMHFEAGGTLLDFDPHKMRRYFKQEFDKAQQTVAQMHKDEQAKANKTA